MKIKVTKVTKWNAPPVNDVRVLGMPNIPDALHGPGCQPRTIVDPKEWERMRKQCYADAGYRCEACGYEHQFPADLHAHELFDIDYEQGTSTFVRLVCLCRRCHLYFIHSGRALTMYKQGDSLYSKERILEGVEHGFKLISEYNKTHKRKIKVFATMGTSYLGEPELKKEMESLIEKYGINFYGANGKKMAAWGDWRMIWDGEEYPTPYKDASEHNAKMAELNKERVRERELRDHHITGGIFDEIDKFLEGEENETRN